MDLTKYVFSSKLVKSQAEILELIYKLKRSEYRGEQAEMNIQRLNVRIDQVCNLLLVFIFLVCLFCNVKIRDVPAFLLSQVCFNHLQIRWRRICSARSTRSKSEFQKSKQTLKVSLCQNLLVQGLIHFHIFVTS